MSSGRAAGRETSGLFAAIDAQDGAAFVSFLTDDAVFRFGSAPPVQGRAAVRAAVESFFDSILGLSHSIDRTLGEGNTLVCEGEVTYTRHDGRIVVVPFVDVFEYEGEQIAEYKIYIDISPLYAD